MENGIGLLLAGFHIKCKLPRHLPSGDRQITRTGSRFPVFVCICDFPCWTNVMIGFPGIYPIISHYIPFIFRLYRYLETIWWCNGFGEDGSTTKRYVIRGMSILWFWHHPDFSNAEMVSVAGFPYQSKDTGSTSYSSPFINMYYQYFSILDVFINIYQDLSICINIYISISIKSNQ